jgi:uncharacterized membrane protein
MVSVVRSPFLIVLLGVASFTISIYWVCWLKYYTFNATYLDLGLSNHVYWLLSHGGVSLYKTSGFGSIYPIQYEATMYFVITPFYAVLPGIPFLLALQTAALGSAAIPLYFLARRRLQARWIPVLIAGIYLTFFSISSAALFDFHNESLFPALFLTAVLAYDTQHKKWFYLVGILAAIIDPLTLLIVLFFTLTTQVPREGRSIPRKLSALLSSVKRDPRDMIFAAALAAVFLVYYLTGYLFPNFVGAYGVAGGPLSILLYSIEDKILVLLLLFGALAFLPLIEWRTSFTLLPYYGFVFYTTDASHWQLFGLQYLQLATGPLFYGLLLALEDINPIRSASEVGQPVAPPTTDAAPPRKRAIPWPSRDRRIWKSRTTKALVAVALVLTLVYFPLSPANQYVTGGYAHGFANLKGITTVTPAVQFLWQVIGLIPPDASVLTQNNIPQLSGREFVETPQAYSNKLPYNYILVDTALTYFSPTSQIAPFINEAVTTGAFGIVAEGRGALLMERGYTGPIRLYVPTVYEFTGSQLRPFAATVNGTTLVGNNASRLMWYGPYVALLPGAYTINFTLSSNRTGPPATQALTLDVSTNDGMDVFGERIIDLGDFSSPNRPTLFELNVTIPGLVSDAEFRGAGPSGAATLTLWNITARSVE